jgi:hypothetical protein
MKFSLLALSHLAFAPAKAMASHLRTKEHSSRNLRKFDESCTAVLVDTQYDPDEDENVFLALGEERVDLSIECLTPSGKVYQVPSADKAFIKKNFIDGDFVSGETNMVFAESISMDTSKSELVLNSLPTLIKKTPPKKGVSGKGRKLAVMGDRSVFAVRIVLSDGQTTASEDAIRDGIFGTDGDAVNLKTQYTNCSHGQLNFDSVGTVSGNALTINNGVITVNLPNNQISDGNTNIRNAINSLINTEFGQYPWQIANHVMYCMPAGVIGGIAFAGVNSWYSVYANEWCNEYSAVQMHEVGHNIGLGHSGEGDLVGSNQYRDQSGNMGFSYSEDDTYMCFNSAKSWQLGWYSNNAITIDAGGVRVYEGDVAGVIEDPFAINVPQVIKLNTPAVADDFFLNFNRRSGFNSGTKEGGNQVLITKTGNEGNSYSPSLLLAKLSAGGTWTSDPVFNGEAVTVTVNSIGTRANVKICVGTCPTVTDTPTTFPSASPVASTGAPTSSPTASPTASPTGSPTSSPTASPVVSTGSPTSSPTASPSASPTGSPTSSPTASPVVSTGSPTSSPSASPVASTGAPTSPPTASPTASPTGSPTSSPSASPTASPTGSPTSSPSASPTASPTGSPTSSPSASPVVSTKAPISSPSASPTASPVASTGSPTSLPSASPTSAPTSSPSASPSTASPVATTQAPSKAPTSGSPCLERTFSNFLLKINKRGHTTIKNCNTLQKWKTQGIDITKICAATASTEKFKPAKDVCQVTCGTCSSNCVELGSDRAYWKTFGKKNHKTTKCEWLAKKSAALQAEACSFDVSPIKKKDVAKVVCPITCKQC